MPTYSLSIKRSASKSLRGIPKNRREKIKAFIHALVETPGPPGCKKLSKKKPLYRIRVGNYRVIYEIRDKELIILVVVIDHRSKAYRRK